jgi:hypothetical protein
MAEIGFQETGFCPFYQGMIPESCRLFGPGHAGERIASDPNRKPVPEKFDAEK